MVERELKVSCERFHPGFYAVGKVNSCLMVMRFHRLMNKSFYLLITDRDLLECVRH